MGRKPKAAKVEGKAHANENLNLPVENMENVQASPTGLPLKEKGPKNINEVIRRSGRLRNLQSPMPNQQMTVEEIDLAASEQEDEPLVEQLNSEPQPPNLQSLESKIDFLVEAVQEFKSQGAKRPFPSETQTVELKYRSLYFESKKKVDELTEENHELAKNLEFAKGKVEAFEQVNVTLGNLKEMAFMTNLGKAAEAILNLSSQLAAGKFNFPETITHPAPAPAPALAPSPLPAGENNDMPPATQKKYSRKKK